ncbi:hypothetical protein RHMOL_Rhmol04G0093000 [Rhododendron molle]|uniref:Uncharacterized protein n=1 Tax=Rhododendron molle TaxID=49168 RepID=A0ACC0P0R4_RHOML|nr:hypothetical protein RHMOL_Rhmol04G0093000 [Rhododendron molle]
MRLYNAKDKKERYAICRYDEQCGDEGSELDFPFKANGLMIGTGSRRELGSAFPRYCVIYSAASQAFVNGAVNWIAKDQRMSAGYPPSILSFDMSAETFSMMMLPPTLADWKQAILYVTSFWESQAVFCNCPRHKDDCCIWVMKEYGVPDSWTKLFSFNLDRPVFLKKILGFRKRGEVLLLTMDNHLLSYDIGTEALVDTGFRGRPNAFYYKSFVESLVSVESKNGVLDGQLNPW